MAVNPSAPCCYNLEEGSLSTRKITTVTKTTKDNDNKTTTFTDIIQPMIVELIGTIFFIWIGLLGACNDESKNNSLIAGLSFGLSLIIFVASLGHISGGHFNPAVTLGVFIARDIQIKKALLYMLMQLIGGIMAAGIFRLLSHTSTYNRCHGGATFLVTIKTSKELGEFTIDGINWWEGMCIELLLTFVFVTIILMVTINKKSKSNFAPIYNGIALCVCIFASNMLTGGSLNPARSLGSAIFANIWSHHYIYWIGPLIGATIAGGFYRFIWGTNDHRISDNK
ncbi:unnamed protein product [Rotaria sordida]|uniref:Aquaporin n=1 Tax=Rotaria sordida TaxID=392033 RepID=A0A818P3B0_9BILA|nr:unnamed protein product [Rotaria sordida]CAF1229533.1 unnamed protein product [Rotaria sordida]CAF1231809.1 unnamed protein product [Rotaria sordida]CAF3613352.1 unnamed protein product [Rotaria sordida]CAF3658894.1 unnamed protein product [Rotaria sordida]